MNAWTDLPLSLRLTLLAVVGLLCGGFINWAIYAWAAFGLPVSPWSAAPAGIPRRRWHSRLPVVGWWTRGSERVQQSGAARQRLTRMGYDVPEQWQPRSPFWLRPMLIDLGFAFLLPWLYWYETQSGALLPETVRNAANIAAMQPWLNWLFLGHALLLVLMTIATFIDFDEQLIPDRITIPGTLLALLLAGLSLHTFLPVPLTAGGFTTVIPCTFAAPHAMSLRWTTGSGLVLGWSIWTVWCFALSSRVVILRRGWRKAVEYFVVILRRDPLTKYLGAMWLLGSVAVAAVWWTGGTAWQGVLTALVGMAVGGGTVWAIRLVASVAMGQEAMGFGDVTLMAMIGAIVGWQASLAAFFIAPFTAIFIVLVHFLATGQRMTPFGPYLCAGTAVTVLYWPTVWQAGLLPAVLLGPVFPIVLLVSLLLMGVLLVAWRAIRPAV
ncbi:prepilin peptidase [Roseimaritima sediminicola]|uniref:prepilin peptidase n=1 Tax=Roseimaritima sediminicola TaxID=2662066 RepID=UPI0012982C7B|nr:A24 family peptidase [Roseimaritima sediminicola]